MILQLTAQQLNRMRGVTATDTNDINEVYNNFMRLVVQQDAVALQLYDELFVEHEY